MATRAIRSAAMVLAGVTGTLARAQDQVVSSLPWTSGFTAGPNGSTYEPPNETRTLWVLEDFGITTDMAITRFESIGTVYPAPAALIDMTVRIYDALPPDGHLIMTSVPGTGRVSPSGLNARFSADFGGQYLRAGSYWVAWTAQTHTNQGGHIAIFWAQDGPHAVGGGLPDNAWQWNPGGYWGFPGNIRPVPADLSGNGHIGVNFTLYGHTSCYANCDGSTATPVLNIADFLCFQQHFAAGDAYANCDLSTTPPTLNIADFLCFMTSFATGCN